MKEEEEYRFWVRPTIQWKLECESDYTRWEVSQKLSELDKDEEKLPERLEVYQIFFAIQIFFTFATGMCTVAASCCDRRDKCLSLNSVCITLV